MIHTINYDFYDVGYDMHNKGFLAVLQVREFYRKKSSYYPEIRKNYFLLGYNEDKTCFAHAVSGRVVMSAIKRSKSIIKSVQDWIFSTDYSNVLRQGDISLQPVKNIKGEKIPENEITLKESHLLCCNTIYKSGKDYFCENPKLIHLKNVHPTIEANGAYKVIFASRDSFWSFAKPTLD